MSGCLAGSVQSNWCQTNLIFFDSKTIDFVSHLDSSKVFHSISSHFLVCKPRKHSLEENTREWMQNYLKNYSVVPKAHSQKRRYKNPWALWMADEGLQIPSSWTRRKISWRWNVDVKNILKVEVWKQTNAGLYSIWTKHRNLCLS